MTLRQYILSKYLHNQRVYEIIGHSNWLYVKICFLYFLLIGIITGGVFVLRTMYNPARLSIVSSLLILLIYLKCIRDLFDDYLDALLITDRGLAHVTWDNPFKHRVDTIERGSLETVSDYQENFLDSLFKKGHLKISLIEDDYHFCDVQDPAISSTMILDYKDMIIAKQRASMQPEVDADTDKYKLLVEALGEVVTDYVERKDAKRDVLY